MRTASLVLSLVCLTSVPPVAQVGPPIGAPESFVVNAQVVDASGAAGARVEVVIRRYSSEAERRSLEDALQARGYPAFLDALRRSADVGYVAHGTSRFAIRYARETRTGRVRRIDLVTDKPIFFVGGGAPEPRARAGFDVAVVRMDVDDSGLGTGVMAAAARLKPSPEGGVQIDDYSDVPIRLASIIRQFW